MIYKLFMQCDIFESELLVAGDLTKTMR